MSKLAREGEGGLGGGMNVFIYFGQRKNKIKKIEF